MKIIYTWIYLYVPLPTLFWCLVKHCAWTPSLVQWTSRSEVVPNSSSSSKSFITQIKSNLWIAGVTWKHYVVIHEMQSTWTLPTWNSRMLPWPEWCCEMSPQMNKSIDVRYWIWGEIMDKQQQHNVLLHRLIIVVFPLDV